MWLLGCMRLVRVLWRTESEVEMRQEGVMVFAGEEYALCNRETGVALPLDVGSRFEVWTEGQWQAVSMQSGGYLGRFLLFADGRRARPALCMRVRPCEEASG